MRNQAEELEQVNQQPVSKSRELEEELEEYYQLDKNFHEKALSMGYGDLRRYYWYHTVDLGNGLVTPGTYDHRRSLPAFKFPANMEGMNVLDVGSATGFFAFEFERREANVISVDLSPSTPADMFPGETEQQARERAERVFERYGKRTEQRDHVFRAGTPEEVYYFNVDGPFKFCHEVLGSKVQRRYSSIYDLSKENLGRDDFDLVFLGDVLVHTIDPLKALAAVTRLCRGTLIISQDVPEVLDSQPAMLYKGGDKLGEDTGVWWLPNKPCFEQLLRKLGFREVAVVGEHSGFMRPEGSPYKRTVIHAVK